MSIVSVRQLTDALSVGPGSKTVGTYAIWFVWYQGIHNAFKIFITLVVRGAWQGVYVKAKKRRHEKITKTHTDYGTT